MLFYALTAIAYIMCYSSTLATLNNLALVLKDQGKLDESELCYRQVAEGKLITLGTSNIKIS
jgi:hypothetical protein